MQRRGDSLLLGFLVGPATVGYYRLARSLAELANLPAGPVFQTTYPEFSRLSHQGQTSQLQSLVRGLFRAMAAVAVLAVLFTWAISEPLIRVAAGETFLPSVHLVNIMVVAVGLHMAVQFLHSYSIAIGKIRYSIQALVLGVATQAVLLVLLVEMIGVAGAAYAYVGFGLARSAWLLRKHRSTLVAPATQTT